MCGKKAYRHVLSATKVMLRAGFDDTMPVTKTFVAMNVSDRMTVKMGIIVS
jgi:hypothetical protein